MLGDLGIPNELEGIAALRVYKAHRLYCGPGVVDIEALDLDGARLRVGELPAAYDQLALSDEAHRSAILGGLLGGARSLADCLQSALENDEARNA